MMETVSAPVWEPDEGGALPWIGLITRSSPSRHYPLINHVMINTIDGGLIILSFGHHHVCSSLSPWCQCSMSFDLSLLLITNVSPSVGNNKSPLDIFAVYGSWTSTALPWWYWSSEQPPHLRSPAPPPGAWGHLLSLSVRDTHTKEDPPSCPRLLLYPTSFFSALPLKKGNIVYLFVCVYHSFYLYSLRLVRLECLECTFCTGATSLNDGCFRFEWLAILECCNTSRTAGFLQRHLFELRKHQQHIFASPIMTLFVFGKLQFYLHIGSYFFCSRF